MIVQRPLIGHQAVWRLLPNPPRRCPSRIQLTSSPSTLKLPRGGFPYSTGLLVAHRAWSAVALPAVFFSLQLYVRYDAMCCPACMFRKWPAGDPLVLTRCLC